MNDNLFDLNVVYSIILFLTRKYRPLHLQSMIFPTLWYSGRFSPFESPPPLFEKQDESKTRFV